MKESHNFVHQLLGCSEYMPTLHLLTVVQLSLGTAADGVFCPFCGEYGKVKVTCVVQMCEAWRSYYTIVMKCKSKPSVSACVVPFSYTSEKKIYQEVSQHSEVFLELSWIH